MRQLPQDDSLNVPIFQLRGERERLTVPGLRCDNGERCTLLLVADAGGSFALYPHGANELGVRIALSGAEALARTILAVVESASSSEAPGAGARTTQATPAPTRSREFPLTPGSTGHAGGRQ